MPDALGLWQTQLHNGRRTCLRPFLVSGSLGNSSRNGADILTSCTVTVGSSKRDNCAQLQARVASDQWPDLLLLAPGASTKAARIFMFTSKVPSSVLERGCVATDPMAALL